MNIARTATRSFPVFVFVTFAFIGTFRRMFLNGVNHVLKDPITHPEKESSTGRCASAGM